MLVSVYIVEWGLILQLYEVECQINEIEALPKFIKLLALQGVVFAFDTINIKKNVSCLFKFAMTTLVPSKGISRVC